MRVYIASKYIAHKELNRKIYEELVHAEIPAFLPESINMDAIDSEKSLIVAESCFNEIEKYNIGCLPIWKKCLKRTGICNCTT